MKFVVFFLTLIFLFPKSQQNISSPNQIIRQIQNEEDTLPSKTKDNTTLQLVSVIFRHGNRTADGPFELYPNDPYLNYSYFPLGYGQITNAGKIRAFSVGSSLRKRYNKFLGIHYYPGIIEALSTNLDRTKTSLQLALAGLFPPRKEDVAATGLTWQPIPFNYSPYYEDRILCGFLCPKYAALYNKYISLPKSQNKFKSYQTTFDYIAKHSGLNISKFQDVYRLYLGLSTEEEYGLTLPEWTKPVWPKNITKIAVEEYFMTTGYPDMRRMAVGYFLEKLLKDINIKIKDTQKSLTKMHIFASHENTIAQLLITLGIFERHVPTYGFYLIFELHKVNGVYGIKILQESWDGKGVRIMKIPSCNEFCPLDVFVSLISKSLPTPGLCD